MKKRTVLLIALIALLLASVALLVLGGGRTDVFLLDFAASEDGQSMDIRIGVSSSAGYVRAVRAHARGDGLYLSFPSTFGINSRVGARDSFTIALPSDCRVIYLARKGGHEPVLERDPIEGQWKRIR